MSRLPDPTDPVRTAIADLQGRSTLAATLADVAGTAKWNKTLADLQGRSTLAATFADVAGTGKLDKTFADLGTGTTLSEVFAKVAATTAFDQTFAGIGERTTIAQALANVAAATRLDRSLAEIDVASKFADLVADLDLFSELGSAQQQLSDVERRAIAVYFAVLALSLLATFWIYYPKATEDALTASGLVALAVRIGNEVYLRLPGGRD